MTYGRDARLQRLIDRLVATGRHAGAVLAVARPGAADWLGSAGELTPDRPFAAASATKLVVAAAVLALEGEGRLSRGDPFRAFLDGPETAGLAVIGGQDLTGQITLAMLLQHTSGLPDYFGGGAGRSDLLTRLLSGEDICWTFAEAMERARRQRPLGPPGAGRRARYSDTNFQILGRVIEAVEGAPLAAVLARRFFVPLGLAQTWIAEDPADARPAPLRHCRRVLHLPKALASFRADGGLVTTAREGLALARAILTGRFCDPAPLLRPARWRPVFFPLDYGEGAMRFALSPLMTGMRRLPPLVGHSGLSGAFLFHAPDTGLTLAGTTNELSRPSAPFRLMAQAAAAA